MLATTTTSCASIKLHSAIVTILAFTFAVNAAAVPPENGITSGSKIDFGQSSAIPGVVVRVGSPNGLATSSKLRNAGSAGSIELGVGVPNDAIRPHETTPSLNFIVATATIAFLYLM
ncbi:hypothetical protein BASA62_004754 [Batrachochytrium salamandrivorans]|nr:hypothetical protein BASA62_004754 [Batrachochytrium salamandrivorans]